MREDEGETMECLNSAQSELFFFEFKGFEIVERILHKKRN